MGLGDVCGGESGIVKLDVTDLGCINAVARGKSNAAISQCRVARSMDD